MRSTLFALLLLSGPLVAAEANSAHIGTFLESQCATCHNADTKSGGFDLAILPMDLSDPRGIEKWARVYDRVKSGEMPPPKKPRPAKVNADKFLEGVAGGIAAGEQKRDALSGRASMRRLNRTEYENTLRDLLDLPGLNIKDLLPDDGRVHGYDKSSSALDVSPILMAKFAEAADVALDAAIAQYSVPPVPFKTRMYANENYDFGVVIPNGDGVMLKDFKYDDSRFPIPKDAYAGGKYKGLGELERSGVWKEKPGTAGLFRCLGESFAGRFSRFSPNFSGRYRVSTSVWSFWWDKGEVKPSPRTQAAGIYYGSRVLGFLDAPSLKPTGHLLEVWLDPDDYLKFDAASLWEVHPYHHKDKAAGFTGPGVAIDYLEVEGPLHDEWPPASHKRLFGDLPIVPFSKLPADAPKPKRTTPRRVKTYDAGNSPGLLTFGTVSPSAPAAEAERLLTEFLPRAFRRPTKTDEIARFTLLAVERIATGACFEDGMRAAYKAALCSPEFLFLCEPLGPLDDYALASRLSYFLWNSIPDATLTAIAEKSRLRDPDELRKQVDRMLADSKSERFISDFLDQWLDLRDIDATTPDRRLYPEYNLYLRDAIRREPYAFFRQLLAQDRSASDLVASDFVMVNQRLAEHYGIPNVSGTHFRPVPVPKDTHRGGFLTQAAILKVTANGTTTTPVKRGAWVNRKILGTPPQPPPPDIAAVEPDVRGATTIREQLAKHRDNATCASCHAKMDPPGFALESFDVIGGLRTKYRATEGKERPDLIKTFRAHLNPEGAFSTAIYHTTFSLGQPVDASGETATGQKFADVEEYRKLLHADRRGLARNLANQFVVYSTGIPVRFADRAALEQILDKAGGDGARVRSLIYETVKSGLFLAK